MPFQFRAIFAFRRIDEDDRLKISIIPSILSLFKIRSVSKLHCNFAFEYSKKYGIYQIYQKLDLTLVHAYGHHLVFCLREPALFIAHKAICQRIGKHFTAMLDIPDAVYQLLQGEPQGSASKPHAFVDDAYPDRCVLFVGFTLDIVP
jgi:hypothetical protein